MSEKFTLDQVREIFESKGNKLLSTEYHNNKTPLHYICDCGEEDWKTINNFRNGQRCKKCGINQTSKKRKLDITELKKLYEDNGCKLIGEYINAQIPVDFLCSCGEKGSTRVREFRAGARCRACNSKKRKETFQKNNNFAQQYRDLFESEGYQMLEPYQKASVPIQVRCPQNHQVPISPANFKTGHRCIDCSHVKRKTYEEINDFFQKEGFTLISNVYTNPFAKLDCICPKNHPVEISWDNFRAGKRCRKCRDSKGEKAVELYLQKNNYSFENQYTFSDCKYKKMLPFDFAVFNSNGSLGSLIEYDGELHYIASDFFGGEKNLRETQKRDKIKTNYCKKNDIHLIRIPYWEKDNISKILDKELNQLVHT